MKRSIKLLAVASSCFVFLTACGSHDTCSLLGTSCEEGDSSLSSGGGNSSSSGGSVGTSSSSNYNDEICVLLGLCTSSSSGGGSSSSGGNSSSSGGSNSSSSGGGGGNVGTCFTEGIYVSDGVNEYYYPIPSGACLEGPNTHEEACFAMNGEWMPSCPPNATLACPAKDSFVYYYDNMFLIMKDCSLFDLTEILDR